MCAEQANAALLALLDDLALEVGRVLGVPVTVEHPGCVVVPVEGGGSWWFGTANSTWGGDLLDEEGDSTGRSVDTGIPTGDGVPFGTIAAGIVAAVRSFAPAFVDVESTREAAEILRSRAAIDGGVVGDIVRRAYLRLEGDIVQYLTGRANVWRKGARS